LARRRTDAEAIQTRDSSMNEPVVIQRGLPIVLMAIVQTITPPLVAVAALYLIGRLWGIFFEQSPSTVAVIVILIFLVLVRLPRDVSSNLNWRPVAVTFGTVGQWLLLMLVLALVGYSTGVIWQYPARAVVTWALVTPILLVASAFIVGHGMRRVVLSAVSSRRVIFAGYNGTSLGLARALRSNATLRLQVEGFFDDRGADRLNVEDDAQLLGGLSDLGSFAKQQGIDVIFIALPIRHLQRVLDLLDDLRDSTASIYYLPDLFVFDLIQARSSELHGFPVVAMCETPFYGYRGLIKRLTDLSLSLCLLTVASPLLLVLAAAVRLSSPGPAIFRQRRYGLDGHQIIVYKLRTMMVTEDGDHVTQASREDLRITPIGRLLRRYSLDELPQLINVIQGRMSLVGPRPHAIAHNEQYRKLIKGYMVRHKVLPGITGLAQINGARGGTDTLEEMEARVRYDLDYLRRWSPMLDLKILLLTVMKVFGDPKAY
jgi:putative colanic acid biosynthesis UDP-glucose lipid carrier transferase